MNSTASFEIHPRHPLAGVEGWPRTGPVYGFADEEPAPPARTFWSRISERLRKAPDESPPQPMIGRIWY
jgi:hypothetical protein